MGYDPNTEHVVLVDEQNQPIGTAPKLDTHTGDTPLHRGFSAFLFNSRGELLLQQRAHSKKTWPLVWSNSVCGHPMMNEASEAAAARRFRDELGLDIKNIEAVLPDYRYRAVRDGIAENEYCPVMVALADDAPKLNPDEVEAVRWVAWPDFVAEVTAFPERYSKWCVEETRLLDASPAFRAWRQRHGLS